MSTRTDTFLEKCPRVIVRAFAGEPVILRAISVKGSDVEVARDDRKTTLFLPFSSVFSFNDTAYQRILAAFKRKDLTKLNRLWDEAEMFQAHANLEH